VVSSYLLRPPTPTDGAPIASLAWEIDGLDRNSSYAYLLWCRDFATTSVVAVCRAFERGLLVETSGPEGEVVKLMPPLTIEPEELEEGLGLFASAVDDVLLATPRART
jgi:hypothetical protein